MSEQIASETVELTAPQLDYAMRLFEGSPFMIEAEANETIADRLQDGWSLVSAELSERSVGGYILMLWFEREAQP